MANTDLDESILKVFLVDPDADGQEWPRNDNGKNQKNIVTDLGLAHDNSKDKVKISRAMKRLEHVGIVERRPNKIDELGKKWAIKTDIETIKSIFKTYPGLQPVLRSNWYILDVVCHEHDELLKYLIEYEANMPLHEIPARVINIIIDDFRGCMNRSTNFFKKCLLYNSEELETMFDMIRSNIDHTILRKDSLTGLPMSFDIAYRACQVADSLDISDTTK